MKMWSVAKVDAKNNGRKSMIGNLMRNKARDLMEINNILWQGSLL